MPTPDNRSAEPSPAPAVESARPGHRIHLSPPHLSGAEAALVQQALAENWVAPAGPFLGRFEAAFADAFGLANPVCLSSGTAAMHLAIRLLGIGPGDEVAVSDMTFVATANPLLYEGAQPVFIDCERQTWNLDPDLLEEFLAERNRQNRLPKAVIAAHVYGQCARVERIAECCATYGVPLIEDAAEALGATRQGRPAGGFGELAVFSFNGNKLLTTGGGGMLTARDPALARRARHLASQAREPGPHWDHDELGYNYRMSNILAAIGCGQLDGLAHRIARRRALFERYAEALGELPGITFMPEEPDGSSTRWLTCLTLDPAAAPVDKETLFRHMEAANIETRGLWTPLHLQPFYRGCAFHGPGTGEELWRTGACLPSSSGLTEADQDRVIRTVRRAFGTG